MKKLLVFVIFITTLSASLIAWVFISKNPFLSTNKTKYRVNDVPPTPDLGTQGTPMPLDATPLPTPIPPEKPLDPSTLLKSESDEITLPDIDMADLQASFDDLSTE